MNAYYDGTAGDVGFQMSNGAMLQNDRLARLVEWKPYSKLKS